MPTPEDIAEDIATSSADPSSVTVGSQTVTQRSIDEKIKAHEFASVQSAASQNRFGLRFAQIVPPGTG